MPTILHFVGFDTQHPLIRRNLMTLPREAPGRSFMQYGSNNAYRVENEVIINRPYLPPEQFKWTDERLVPAALNADMARDALAHAHVP